MKATMGLTLSFMSLFIVWIIANLLTGPLDVDTLEDVALLIPPGVLLYFCRRRKSWAYAGTSVLGIVLVVAISADASLETWQQITPLLMSGRVIATIVLALMALEGYKAYVESREL